MFVSQRAASILRRGAYLTSVSAMAMLLSGGAEAGQLPASAFTAYNAANASSIVASPYALYAVGVNSISPTQMDEGLTEVGKKTAGWDLLSTLSSVENTLLTGGDIEPVVIGPGGKLYLTDGHHTFTALLNSIWGADNPTVYVVVIANYSNLTQAQFWATMQANNFLLPSADGVAQTVNTATGSPIPTTLALSSNGNNGMQSDPYRGLEYSILKNKNSVLFTTANNVAGVAGSSIPGLDKTAAFYSDFIWADAFRSANSGSGLAYLSPGDIQLATQWALNGASVISGVGNATTVSQLPGYILPASITITGVVSNTTIGGTSSQSGVLDGSKTGTFDQNTTFASFNGLRSMAVGASTIGVNAPGFVMQLGEDKGYYVTLSGANTYTQGTTMVAGTLSINSDAALGAAVPSGWALNQSAIISSVEAGNGIVFNSLTEGNGTILATATMSTARPIAVESEQANINAAPGTTVTLTGPIVSIGPNNAGLGNANGESDLSFNSQASGDTAVGAPTGTIVVAPSSGANPYFYGNLIISAGTLSVSSDAAMGNVTGPAYTIGSIDLDGGTFQPLASFNSVRNIFLTGGSTFATNGTTTTFNSLTNVQRTLTVTNTTTSAGSVAFTGGTTVAATSTFAVNGGTAGASLNLGAITRADTAGNTGTGAGPATATVLLVPTSGSTLGVTDKIFASGGATTLVNGIVAPWIVINNSATNNNYDFATYNASTGYGIATYSTNLATATATSVEKQSANVSLSANTSATALNLQKGFTVTLASGKTLTLGDGTDPAGLIMSGSSATITGGTLAFGASEAVVSVVGANIISSAITGTGGLTLAGSGTLTLSGAETLTGPISVDSGTLVLNAANMFSTLPQIVLSDTKSKPSAALLTVNFSNTLAALSSAGNNSTVAIASGAVLTIGDTTNNDSSTLSSTITQSGSTAQAGVLTFNGTGLADLSGMKKNTLTLAAGSSIIAEGGSTLRLSASSITNGNNIALNGGNLQFAQNGGGIYGGAISGGGSLRLIGGTLQLTGTNNTYTGGTFVETGSTLDLTTANVSSGNANIGVAGGQVVFDQATSGTYSGVIGDAMPMGQTGVATMSGSLVKDDSTGANGGNVTLTAVQAYTGSTTIEAGTLTLNVANALALSQLVDIGRIGGGATATLAINQNQTLQSLTSEAGDTTAVTLAAGTTLTLGTTDTSKANPNANSNFAGTISGGALVTAGSGTVTLTGANAFSGVGTGADVSVTGGTLNVSGANTYANHLVSVSSGATFQATTANLDTALKISNSGSVLLDPGTGNSTWAGSISGSGALTKIDSGNLTLTGANTFTGMTTVYAGTLTIGSGSNLGTSSQVVLNGGTTLALNQSQTLQSLNSGSGSGTANVTLASGTALTLGTTDTTKSNANANSSFAGTISGGALVKAGSGTATLSGANAFAGTGTGADVTVSGGTLAVSGANTYANHSVAVSSGATFQATAVNLDNALKIVDSGTVVLDSGSTAVTWGGAISGTGTLTKIGSSTLTLSGANTYTGLTTISAGSLVVAAGGSLASQVVVNAGSFTNNSSSATTITSLTGGTVALSGTGTNTVSGVSGSGVLNISNGSTTVTSLTTGGTVNLSGGTANLTTLGTGGTATVSGGVANVGTFSGGSLTVSNGNATIGTESGSAVLNINGGSTTVTNLGGTGTTTLAMGAALTVSNLTASGAITLGSGASLTAGSTVANANNTYSGTLTGGTLDKVGTDTLTLSSKTITSNLSLQGGTLNLASGVTDSGAIAVQSGTLSLASGATASGAITVQNGTFNLASGATDSGTVTVQNGTVNLSSGATTGAVTVGNGGIFDDTGTVTNVTVNSGGRFGGGGTVSGNLIVAAGGTLSPGFSPATTTVTGSVAQGNGSTLSLDIDGTGTGTGAGNYSRLLVSGAYTIGTGDVLQLNLRGITGAATNTYTPALGTDLTVVKATGGVSGTFATVNQTTLPGTHFDVVYSANAIDLFVTPASYGRLGAVGVSASANENSVGAAIDKLRSAGMPGAVLPALYALPATQITTALDQISGVSHANSINADISRSALVTHALDGRISALRDGSLATDTANAGLVGGTQLAFLGSNADMATLLADAGDAAKANGDLSGHIWGRGVGGLAQVGADNNGSSFHSSTGGAVGGVDTALDDNLNLGLAGGITKTSISGGNDITSYSGHVYGTYGLGAAFVDGNAGYAFNQYTSSRGIGFVSQTANGKADGNDLTTGIKTGYRLMVDDTLIEPAFGLDYLRAQRDAFTETGAGSLNLNLGDTSHNSLQSTLGSRVVRSYMLNETFKIEPEISAGWKHDFLSRVVTNDASVNGAGYTVGSSRTGRDGAVLGLGMAASNSANTKVFVDYTGEARQHETDQTVTAGIRITW